MGIHVEKEKYLFLVSTLNYLSRVLTYRAPYTRAYREGNEQHDGKEDTDIYPPSDGCLLHVLRHPLLHDDIAYGEGHGRGGKNDESVLLYKYGEDIVQCSAMYLAQGNLLATLRTGKRHDGVYTEYGYEDAHCSDDTEDKHEVGLTPELVIEGVFKEDQTVLCIGKICFHQFVYAMGKLLALTRHKCDGEEVGYTGSFIGMLRKEYKPDWFMCRRLVVDVFDDSYNGKLIDAVVCIGVSPARLSIYGVSYSLVET